jgi:hypothetical protein
MLATDELYDAGSFSSYVTKGKYTRGIFVEKLRRH